MEEFLPAVDGDAKPPEKSIEKSKSREQIRHILIGSPEIVKLTITNFSCLAMQNPVNGASFKKHQRPVKL